MRLSHFLPLAAVFAIGCGSSSEQATPAGSSGLSGNVQADGSSTVFPITAAVAEEFKFVHPDVQVAVSYSGTGGGFKKFDIGETDMNNASRPIKQIEIDQATSNGVEFIELPIAFDGVSVIINPKNDFVDYLTAEELNAIWEPGSTVTTWSQVRSGWPEEEIKLYGPGPDSGTFDYFTEAINGDGGACRSDFTASEDDNLIVTGVAGDRYALGFLGYAYFVENQSIVNAVPIQGEGRDKAVGPTSDSIMTGTYFPLSRPLFIYVRLESAERPEVDEFIRFYLANAPELVPDVGYIQLPQSAYDLVLERYENRVTGSVFAGEGATVGVSIEDILSREGAG